MSVRPESTSIKNAPFGLALFFVALLPRMYVALNWSGEAVWDGHYYDFGAKRIAEGFGYSDSIPKGDVMTWHPWCHYPVGYSAAIGLIYKLFGESLHVASITNACVGAALAVVTWMLAKNALTETRARIAGAIVAIHPGLILYSALMMSEPLAALLTLLAFAIATMRNPDRAARNVLIGALVLGVATLVRPQALLCAPFLALPLLRRPIASRARRFAHFIAAAIVTSLITLIPVLPWTARNCRVMDGCALVSTNGGWNLAIGAFPRATGRFETLHASDGCRDVTGQVEQDRCWFAYGLNEIKAHPIHWLALIPKKLAFTFDHESFAVEYLHEARPDDWPESRRTMARNITTVVHRVLLLATPFAWIAFRTRGANRVAQSILLAAVAILVALTFAMSTPTFWPIAVLTCVLPLLPIRGAPYFPDAMKLAVAFLATTLATHAIFFGEDRYHIVVTPILALFAAAVLRPSSNREAEL